MKRILVFMLLLALFGTISAEQKCKHLKISYAESCMYLFKIKKLRLDSVLNILETKQGIPQKIKANKDEFAVMLTEIDASTRSVIIEQKMKYASYVIVEVFILGGYADSVQLMRELKKRKSGTAFDIDLSALLQQLTGFYQAMGKIGKGRATKNCNLIIDNTNALIAIAQNISKGKTLFMDFKDNLKADGHTCLAKQHEKYKEYIKADENFSLCLDFMPESKECKKWFANKETLCKNLIAQAKISSCFNPAKSKEQLNTVLKILTFESPLYKKAEKEYKKLP